MSFKNVLVVGANGSDLVMTTLKGVPEDKAMEYAVAWCQKMHLQYKTCIRCDNVTALP